MGKPEKKASSTQSMMLVTVGIFILLITGIMVIYSFSIPRKGMIILPAGENYLGAGNP